MVYIVIAVIYNCIGLQHPKQRGASHAFAYVAASNKYIRLIFILHPCAKVLTTAIIPNNHSISATRIIAHRRQTLLNNFKPFCVVAFEIGEMCDASQNNIANPHRRWFSGIWVSAYSRHIFISISTWRTDNTDFELYVDFTRSQEKMYKMWQEIY